MTPDSDDNKAPSPASDNGRIQGEARRLAEIEQLTSVVSGLNRNQRSFLVRYLLHGNATQAAREAGYAWPDKSGPRLLQNKKIRSAIDEYFYQQEMSAREVIARLSQQAKAEYAHYLRPRTYIDEETGAVVTGDVYVDVSQMIADGRGHLIKGIKYTRDGRPIVEFYDAHQALVDIGRYHGLFSDRIDANVATRGDGMTVEEWREEAAKRRRDAATAVSEFEDDFVDEEE